MRTLGGAPARPGYATQTYVLKGCVAPSGQINHECQSRRPYTWLRHSREDCLHKTTARLCTNYIKVVDARLGRRACVGATTAIYSAHSLIPCCREW